MPEIPECLNYRYKALDELIKELNATISSQNSLNDRPPSSDDVGIKLMCDFWNILKEDPDCNLTQEVQRRMGVGPRIGPKRSAFGSQRFVTYMAGRDNSENSNPEGSSRRGCCTPVPDPKSSKKPSSKAPSADTLPLTKVLCNLKEAASFDQKCHDRVKELLEAQQALTQQIQILENREREGMDLLKQADSMWLSMEEAYKKKIAESIERQKELLKEIKEVEESTKKWRQNKKDLEFQIQNMSKLKIEIIEKMNQKKNDLKIMETEIKNLQKRLDDNKKDIENAQKSLTSKKELSDAKMTKLAAEVAAVQKKTQEERIRKKKKVEEGNQYVREARDDLQKICKTYLQKKLENEDLRAEKKALLEEIQILQTTCNSCKEKCQNKAKNMLEEIKKVSDEIAVFKIKCIKCHVCTDTNDVRKVCTDCPKCLKERDCIVTDDHCTLDHAMDCVCMSVKQKFLDNVFDNMYTVLERQARTRPGKAVADAVLKALKTSRNGKLTQDTRKILQDFILTTVKRNLNLTIVGGAVKTRCEMDPDTYKQLMTCLKDVKAVKPPKEDKGTAAKKDPCKRWGGETECNCPKGPKDCICSKKAPKPPDDPTPCPQDKEDKGPVTVCPHKAPKPCGIECSMQGKPKKDAVPTDIAAWRPDPCSGPSCTFSKNMRAAQCMLGSEGLTQRRYSQTYFPDLSAVDKMVTCMCHRGPVKSCTCNADSSSQPRLQMIEEVMGTFNEVDPVAKVSYALIRKESPAVGCSSKYKDK